MALDGDDELGEVAVADDAPELLLGDEHASGGPALARADPDGLSIELADRVRVGLDGSGLRVRVKLDRGAPVHVAVRTPDLQTEPSGNATHDRPVAVTLATLSRELGAGTSDLALGLGAAALGQLVSAGSLTAIVTVVALDGAGRQRVAARRTQLRI